MSNGVIKKIYAEYFQKSRVFLFPVLGIKRGSIIPIQSYIGWEGTIKPADRRLVCLYYRREDPDFRTFERKMLLENTLFESYHEVTERRAVYTFDLSKYAGDWEHFLNGRYSKLSEPVKSKIKEYFRGQDRNYAYVCSYVHPEKYFAIYSDLLKCSMRDLKIAGELCDRPDVDKETLQVELKGLEVKNIVS